MFLVFAFEIVSSVVVWLHRRSAQSKLDYESVLLVTRYLASNRPFSQSFDIYLTQVMVMRAASV